MTATSLDLSQIKTDALSSAAAFRALIGSPATSHTHGVGDITGLGTLATQSPTGTPSASTFLRGDFSWQTIDLSGYVPYSGASGAVNLGSNSLTAGAGTFSGGVLSNTVNLVSGSDITISPAPSGSASSVSFAQNGFTYFRAMPGSGFLATSTRWIGWSSAAWNPTGSDGDLFLFRDAANTLGIRNSTNSQRLNLYGTYTDASNYRRLFLSSTTAGAFTLGVEGAGTGASGNTLTLSSSSINEQVTFAFTGSTNNIIANYAGYYVSGTLGNAQLNCHTNFTDRTSFKPDGIRAGNHGSTPAKDFVIDFHAPLADYVPKTLSLIGQAARTSAVTNLSGGNILLAAGDGASASAGAANGGNIYLDGGQGYGTGVHGSIIIGNTRAGGVTMSATSLTGSQATSLLSMTQTWNTTGTPTLLKANVTDTASNAASLLMDLQVGGSSKLKATKQGYVTARSFATSTGSDLDYNRSGLQLAGYTVNAGVWFGPGAAAAIITETDANTLALRNSIYGQTFRIYNTFTDSSNYERAKVAWSSNVLQIGTEKAGTGSARALELQTDGVTRLTIDTSGNTTLASGTSLNVGGATTACLISSNSGVARIDFLVGGSYVGNINSSSNTLRLRAPSGVAVRNNNDTADAAITAAAATFSGNVTITQGTSDTSVLTSTGYSLTGSNAQSLIDVAGTWNTTGTPTLLKANVTDTASNAASLLLDLQVGGSSKFSVLKDGNISIASLSGLRPVGSSAGVYVYNDATTPVFFRDNSANQRAWLTNTGFSIASTYAFAWSFNATGYSSPDLFLYRDAAQTLAQRNGLNPQVHRVYNTYTDASNYERAKIAWESNVLVIGSEKAGTGSDRNVRLQSGANTLTLDTSGYLTMVASLFFSWSGRTTLGAPSAGVLRLIDDGGGSNPRIVFQGTTSSFPAIKRNAAALNFRLADDSADCDITAKAATFSGNVTITQGTSDTSVLTSTGYSLTGSNAQSLIDVAGTWNTTGTPTLIKANVTDTASNANSLLMDLQVGGDTRAKIEKAGDVYAKRAFTFTGQLSFLRPVFNGDFLMANSATGTGTFFFNHNDGRISLRATHAYSWSSTGDPTAATDLFLFRDAAQTLAQRNSTNAQTFRVYNTFTDASNYERAKVAWESNVLKIGTEKAGTGTSRPLQLDASGSTGLYFNTDTRSYLKSAEFYVNNVGGISNTGVRLSGGGNDSIIMATSSTDLHIAVFSATAATVIGKTSDKTVGLKVSGLGDITLQSNTTINDAINIAVGTTTGTKIGTATTQKLGFFNATPVVQPTTAVASSTTSVGLGTGITDDQTFDGYTVAQVVKALRNLGLLA